MGSPLFKRLRFEKIEIKLNLHFVHIYIVISESMSPHSMCTVSEPNFEAKIINKSTVRYGFENKFAETIVKIRGSIEFLIKIMLRILFKTLEVK